MKIFCLLTIFAFASVVSSCGSRTDRKAVVYDDSEVFPDSTFDIPERDDQDAFFISLEAGRGELTLYKEKDQTLYVDFRSGNYTELSASLSSDDPEANIRFEQIFLPSGLADGPFGRQFTYDLLQQGVYRLSIHENIMAGNPWSGELTVTIQLSDRID